MVVVPRIIGFVRLTELAGADRSAPRSSWAARSGRPLRRDGKDQPDLADIGGETGAATHGAILAQQVGWPKPVRVGRESTL
jgi:hypothetical protein